MTQPTYSPASTTSAGDSFESTASRPARAETVSIVMRTTDRPILLHRALASVLSQRFADWHLYLVNEGGDQRELELVLAEYAAPLAGRLTLKHTPASRGAGAAWNRCLELARGDYYVIHGDGDSWHPEFLERTVRFLSDPKNTGFVCVVTNCHVIKERIVGDKIVEVESQPWTSFAEDVSLDQILAAPRIPPITQLIRRAVLARVGKYNPAPAVRSEWDFNIRALVAGDFGVIPDRLAYRHQRLSEQALGHEAEGPGRSDALTRNGALRTALLENPTLIGVLQPILSSLHEQRTTLQAGLARLDANLADAGRRHQEAAIAAGRLAEERYATIQQMDRMIHERDEALRATSKLAEERYETIQEMGRMIRERDEALEATNRLAGERYATLQQMDRMIRERDEALQATSRLAEERYATIREMDQMIRERDAAIHRLTTQKRSSA